jgi:hypothetical protein
MGQTIEHHLVDIFHLQDLVCRTVRSGLHGPYACMQSSGYPTMHQTQHPAPRSSLPNHERRRHPEAQVRPQCAVLLRHNAGKTEWSDITIIRCSDRYITYSEVDT